MTYVEWLRVRNCLKVLAIVLAILVALAVVLRISVSRYMSPSALVHHISLDPGTRTSSITLPDGTKRVILDNPSSQTHVIIDDHGSAGKRIIVTEPTSRKHKENDNISVGSIHVMESRNGAMTTTVIDTNGAVPMIYYMAIADVFALIVATVLAAPLAREIVGHLEITLTKPVSRVRYALGAMGVDVVGILAASVLTVIAFYLCQLLFETPRLDFSGINSRAILMGIAAPLAWYAMLCAATTWAPRAYGVLLGLIPLGLLFVGVLTLIPTTNVVALFIHDVAWVISRFDPLTYVSMAKPNEEGTMDYSGGNFPFRISMQALFFIGYGALALWRWQRVEA
ncbi:MAG TPA: hypothetical protein VGI19_05615 [Candidatus Cybelea sp.]|jgi:hypothetical protein